MLDPAPLKTRDFYYELPDELIARYPTENRSASRLLCLARQPQIVSGSHKSLMVHHHFHELADLLQAGDLLVFNNTRVIPARLFGHKETGGRLEVLLERLLGNGECLAHIRNGKSLKPGACVLFDGDTDLEMLGRAGPNDELFHLKAKDQQSLIALLEQQGHMPLPPYIDREDEFSDKSRYQTVYSKVSGAVAAPTAGLHFDEGLLQRLKDKGVENAEVTLHVGAGTFQPVRVENIADHKMHSEWFALSEQTAEQINKAKAQGRRVIAVGTTSVRCLESASEDGELKASEGETDIFITPGYEFKCVDGLITNFHLPESTLLMLVSAFAGKENIFNAYNEAIKEKYRFFSYGDGMLII